MSDFKIRIADNAIAISAIFSATKEYCKGYLCNDTAALSITMSSEDIAFEREKSLREEQMEGITPRNHSDSYLETIAVQRKITEGLFAFDTLLFHGSVVAVDGQGYLFTAKSGTGKSTHTRFWRETFGERAVMVNDDKPFLRITQDGVIAYGSPWNGKHKLGNNISVPLKAMCILERGEENHIQAISGSDAATMLFQQSNRPMDPRKMPKYMDLIDQLSKKTSFYRMQCNLDPSAAQVAFDAMSK
ncbi:MAG: hypothetical protein J6A88_04160 [Oscillospiraceae bacterium]|nr:hypothetical protein [Oscillospiraceae bacterium]